MFILVFCMFCFLCSVFCGFVLFLLMYIVVSFLFVYKFTDRCHRVETQLKLINIISNHTKSDIIYNQPHSTYLSYRLGEGYDMSYVEGGELFEERN
jgi:hypothetical protein